VQELQVDDPGKGKRGAMANESVTLYLDGTPNIGDFATAMAGMRDLIAAIETEVAPSSPIEWRIETLLASSALATFRGESTDMGGVGRVAERYVSVGKDASNGIEVPQKFAGPLASITGLLSDRIPSIRLENEQDDETLTASNLAKIIPLRSHQELAPSPGAVEGRIETVSSHNGLRFVLYDLNFNKAVTCYLAPGSEEQMLNAWGRIAVVEGVVKRDPQSGRPLVIRQVTGVTLVEEGNRGDWRKAIGVLPKTALRSDEQVRRMRDAQ